MGWLIQEIWVAICQAYNKPAANDSENLKMQKENFNLTPQNPTSIYAFVWSISHPIKTQTRKKLSWFCWWGLGSIFGFNKYLHLIFGFELRWVAYWRSMCNLLNSTSQLMSYTNGGWKSSLFGLTISHQSTHLIPEVNFLRKCDSFSQDYHVTD